MEKIRIQVLAEKHIDQASNILSNNFLRFNTIWKKQNLNQDEITVLMRGRIIKALEIDQSFVMYEESEMIGVLIHLDMLDYMSYPAMPNNLEFSEKLKKVTQNLDGLVDISKAKRGQIMYGTFSSIDQKYANKGYLTYFLWVVYGIIKTAGWKQYYARCSNIASAKAVQRLGGKSVGQYDLTHEGECQKFILMKLDIQNFSLTHSKIKLMLSNKKKKLNAKL